MSFIFVCNRRQTEKGQAYIPRADVDKIEIDIPKMRRQGDTEHSQIVMQQLLQESKYMIAVAQENNRKGIQACRQRLKLLKEHEYQRDEEMLQQIQRLHQFEKKQLERRVQLNDTTTIQLKHKSEALEEDNIQLKHKSEALTELLQSLQR